MAKGFDLGQCLSCISFSHKFPCVLTAMFSVDTLSYTRDTTEFASTYVVGCICVRCCVDRKRLRWSEEFSTLTFRDHTPPHGGTTTFATSESSRRIERQCRSNNTDSGGTIFLKPFSRILDAVYIIINNTIKLTCFIFQFSVAVLFVSV